MKKHTKIAIGVVALLGGLWALCCFTKPAHAAEITYRVDALGRQVPAETYYPWEDDERVGIHPRSTDFSAEPVDSGSSITYRTDGLGRRVPAQTYYPWQDRGQFGARTTADDAPETAASAVTFRRVALGRQVPAETFYPWLADWSERS